MRSRDLKEVIRVHLKSGSGKNELGSIFIEGHPGIGKSEIVTTVAREENAECIDFRLLLRDPSDLLGIPYPDLENGTAKWLVPSELPVVGNHKMGDTGILFFDDMTTAPPLVQAAAYQLTLTPHRIGEAQLKEGWVIVAAGNMAGTKSLVHDMPRPLANRFTSHIKLEVNLDDWVGWAVEHKINASIIAFMHSSIAHTAEGHLLFNFDPKKVEKAFPSPRTWTKASRIMEETFSTSVRNELLTGCIGAGAAAQFSTFERLFEKIPDVKEILDNGNFDITPKGSGAPDLKYAMVVAVAHGASTKKRVDNAIKWATECLEPEFGVLLVKIIGVKNDLIIHSKTLKDWITKNKEVWA